MRHGQRTSSIGKNVRTPRLGMDAATAWKAEKCGKKVMSPFLVLTAKEAGRMKTSIERNRPLGRDAWVQRMAGKLKLEHTLRPEGRPKNAESE